MVEMIDESGKPQSDEDLQDAITTIEKLLIKPPMELPMLAVMLPTIRQLLKELQTIRKVIHNLPEAPRPGKE